MFGRIEDVTAEEIIDLFKPFWSSNEAEKRLEEIVIYNFRKFLNRVQRKFDFYFACYKVAAICRDPFAMV
jgi:glutamate dehydrogenase/leucine dehydrogenase